MGGNVRFDFNKGIVRIIEQKQRLAACAAMEKARQRAADLEKIPFDKGRLQGETIVDISGIKGNEVKLVSNAEYAERLYFRPELKFKREHNKNAEAYWFEGFISGGDKEFIEQAYADELKELMS